MSHRIAALLPLALLSLTALVAPPGLAATPQTPSAATATQSFELPDPDLSGLEPAVAEQLRELRTALLAALGQGATTAATAADLFGELGRHYHAYRLDGAAETCYSNAEELAPGEQRWPYYRGVLAEQRGELDAAVGHLARALARNPEMVAGLVRLGEVYRQLGRVDESALLFSIALRLSPRSPAALAGLGELALADNRYDDAIALLTAALEEQPGANRLRQPLAMAYRGRGDLDAARQQLEQRGTVGVRPPDPFLDEIDRVRTGERALVLQGRMAYGAGRFEEAAALFQKAVEAQPESAGALVNLSAALTRLRRNDEAIAALRRALQIDDENATAHYNLAQLLLARNDLAAAAEELGRAASALPQDAAVQGEMARLLRRLGRTAEAIPYFAIAARLDPSSEDLWLAGGDALAELGRYQEARSVLEQGLALLPAGDRLEAGLARFLATCPDPAVRDGERAFELALHSYEAKPSTGRAESVALALGELGRCTEAAGWQQTAIATARGAGDQARVTALQRDLGRYDGPACRPPIAPPATPGP